MTVAGSGAGAADLLYRGGQQLAGVGTQLFVAEYEGLKRFGHAVFLPVRLA